MTTKRRRQFTANFKKRVALEALCNRDAPDRGAKAEKQRRWRERRAAGGR